jgi:putative Mg2+ transporter-C (MgtC) family protein
MSLLHCSIYEINIISVLLRTALALVFGGIIGLERGANRHPAGFRTYILVCVGAALAMMTNQYMLQTFEAGDPARLGAQVITGVGFLGVGTILVTGRSKIKGLTTAAGLWASACLGLALGIGFYSGACIAAVVIFVSMAMLPKVENYFYRNSRVINLYIEVDTIENFRKIKKYITSLEYSFYESHLSQTPPITPSAISFNVSLHLPKGVTHHETVEKLEQLEGVCFVEEL